MRMPAHQFFEFSLPCTTVATMSQIVSMKSSFRTSTVSAFRPAVSRTTSKAQIRRFQVVRASKDPERAAKDAGRNIKEGLEGAYEKGKDALSDFSDEAGDKLDDAEREGRKAANKTEGKAKDAAGRAESEGKGLGATIKDKIAGAADAVRGKAKDVKQSVKD